MMEKYQKVISAVILAAGLMVLGLCIKSGIDNFTNKDRRVTVKGLSERIVDADKATWTLTVEKSGDELNSLYASLNSDVATIQTFLEENGVEGKATVKTSTINVNDNLSNAWGETSFSYVLLLDAALTRGSLTTTTFGKTDGRERALARVLHRAKIPLSDHAGYAPRQLCHLAMVVPIADAYYEAADPGNAGRDAVLMRKTAEQIRDNLSAIAARKIRLSPGKMQAFRLNHTARGMDTPLCISKLLRGSVHVPAFDESAG